MQRFVVCIHDATPAYTHETRKMLWDLAPLVGRRLSFGVVPDWHGQWPLTAHREYCGLLRDNAGELLLHGYFHRRDRGYGPITLLTRNGDEMNGLDRDETQRIIARGQRVFTEVFGAPARGFLAPAWQAGHVRSLGGDDIEVEYVLGFFSLVSRDGPKVPLATWSWDCGRCRWLGHVGHGMGWLRQSLNRGVSVPVLAIHPRDLKRGFWPQILRLTRALLDAGYEPSTPAALLEAHERCAGHVKC